MEYALAITLFLLTTAFGIATFILSLDVLAKDLRASKKLIIFLVLGIVKTCTWLLFVEKSVEPLLFIGLLVELFLFLSLVLYLLFEQKLTKDKKQ